jgi:hypothetical protein
VAKTLKRGRDRKMREFERGGKRGKEGENEGDRREGKKVKRRERDRERAREKNNVNDTGFGPEIDNETCLFSARNHVQLAKN